MSTEEPKPEVFHSMSYENPAYHLSQTDGDVTCALHAMIKNKAKTKRTFILCANSVQNTTKSILMIVSMAFIVSSLWYTTINALFR